MIRSRLIRRGLQALSSAPLGSQHSLRVLVWPSCRSFSSSSASGEGDGAGSGEQHQFKAETKKLLNIVAHSLYTDKEVFIRELISNASDALEKLRFLQATGKVEDGLLDAEKALEIRISVDPEKRTFTIEDTGVGMTKEEMIDHLGTIAKSGSMSFLEDPSLDAKDKANAIIGQFGVGFYSTFVVADKVKVTSRAFHPDSRGWEWESDGLGSFTVTEKFDLPRGTSITCHLKEECGEFASEQSVKACAKKFSSFISFPLAVSGEEVTAQEALWLKRNATPEEHERFFQFLSGDSYSKPLYSLPFHTDAPLSIKSVFYVPETAPMRLFQNTREEVGVSLHSRRVLVKKAATEIVPRWLGFVKGVVDCDDLPLNVSRENMQDSRLMSRLSHVVVSRLLKFLFDQSKEDKTKYEQFYKQYSTALKEGVLEDTHTGSGKHRDNILRLLRFESSESPAKELTSLDEYITQMKENQQNIYCLCAADRHNALASPYMEFFKRRKRPVLLMYEDIDEFLLMNVQSYKDKKLVAIDSSEEDFEELLEDSEGAEGEEGKEKGEAGGESEKGKQEISLAPLSAQEQGELEAFAKRVLADQVSGVKFSTRLHDSPAVVTGFISSGVRKMMKAAMKSADGVDAFSRVPVKLELNPGHKIIKAIHHAQSSKSDKGGVATVMMQQILDNACIAAGMVDDPRTLLERLQRHLQVTADFVEGNVKDDYESEEKKKKRESTGGDTGESIEFGKEKEDEVLEGEEVSSPLKNSMRA
uniref:Histidine kinase/HSP90-like ATPase domain-containing protein n=1 Tax=Chromera velia CCMP2878 TaxID=1169474 RepID=A0A0G4H766_9ALVE|mmetsp:Transcript_33614/g.66591  ORF Transcript_33614/g.66591 Transcript_33614/m.66591 type:complete len:757 (-) Transcript_33614:486-2756(-)|eukprot:Cvel_24977.t1-p1 / transcript=Cvel_24977.t1 / gene=Cvel_24977 / organism=Chromera_velia_CCMP2878 / gene_product=Heat shock protein 75 kDa, mitochondrial, putative / transcript_product=Heat shock protein 75 kDa, mitochondrial, putative / location=Cvel_scaffold2767:5472-12107(+) / protein_length=756 / sequence_SO=supercontig / SO=protein_coding / is_pseudo=false